MLEAALANGEKNIVINALNANIGDLYKNCVLYGRSSFGSSLISVSFYDSKLYGNGTYALIRSYVNLYLENCNINTKEADHTDAYSEGVEAISPATKTEKDCVFPAMSTVLSSEDGSKITVNNLSFGGDMSALMLGHYVNSQSNWYNTELNNVNVIGAEVVSFSSNVSPGVCIYGIATLNDCNIYGTTLSALDTDSMWPVYDLALVNYSKTTVNRVKINLEAGSSVGKFLAM